MNWVDIVLFIWAIGYVSMYHHIEQSHRTPLGTEMSRKDKFIAIGHSLLWPVGVSYFIYLNIKWENRRDK